MFFDNIKNEAEKKQNLAIQLEKHKDITLANDDYIIRAYKDYDELVAEGNNLQNAIAYYALNRYANGEDILFTFRLAKEPDKSYGALEFSTDGKLRLAEYARVERISSKEELNFIEAFRKTVLLPFLNNDESSTIKMEFVYDSVKPGDVLWAVLPKSKLYYPYEEEFNELCETVCEIKVTSITCKTIKNDDFSWEVDAFSFGKNHRYIKRIKQKDLFKTDIEARFECEKRNKKNGV